MIDFLINFPSKAPYDTALLLITAVYAFVAWRVLAAANYRDHTFAARMKYCRIVEASARNASKSSALRRPNSAEFTIRFSFARQRTDPESHLDSARIDAVLFRFAATVPAALLAQPESSAESAASPCVLCRSTARFESKKP